MCCAFALLAILGPRALIFFWWLADPARWSVTFNNQVLVPVLGFVFLPWTTVMYVVFWGLPACSHSAGSSSASACSWTSARTAAAPSIGTGCRVTTGSRDEPVHCGRGRGPRMTPAVPTAAPEETTGDRRLPILLAMAMFVLVVDTSIMNVSISAVVADLGTDVSAIQSAIALEALVSAAFILIGSKIGDLFGRKRAYILGLLAYAVGALAMALSQTVLPIFIFWAVIGGLGASLLLPAMQSLIHGNFEGAAQKATYALVGAAAAIAAAIGPLIGGFITTFLSYRVAFLLEVGVIAIVLLGSRLVKDVPYTGPREIDLVGALLSVLGMGGLVLGILVWQEGGEAVGLLLAIGVVSLAAFAYWLRRRKREGKPTLIDPDLFKSMLFRFGITGQLLQNVALGGVMITLPIYLQMVLEYNALQSGLSIAPLSLSMFAAAILAGRRSGNRRPSSIIRAGYALLLVGLLAVDPDHPQGRRGLVPGGPVGGRRDRAGVAGLPAQQLHPVADRRGTRQ